ncbi:hypothetical protein [Flaviaesturariibacter amylovorans]|uniref:Uncharacterized protein n=1 Tax=Flaviaesturariibacter amylovorans TaxID=1084520 RepID=A0ABP8GLE4_9BACT
MAQRLYNRYSMQMAVKACMEKNRSRWAGNPFIPETMDYISVRLRKAQELFDKKEQVSTEGHTLSKNVVLDGIAARAWLMSTRLVVFARKKGLRVLLTEVDHPRSYFERGPEVERIARAAAITEKAEHYLPQLEPYKIRMSDVASLNADIEQVRPLSSERDAVGDEAQQLTNSLPRLLQEVQDKLYELDEEITAFMDEFPDFQDQYFYARRTTDRKATHA